MILFEDIKLALSSLKINKMRTILTMLGIVIGIASVIAIIVVGDAMSNNMMSSFSNMGANNITFYVQQMDDNQQSTMKDKDYINQDMLDQVKKRFVKEISDFALSLEAGSGTINQRKAKANVSMLGINEAYLKANNIKMLSGTAFTQREQKDARKTALVSDKLVDQLFLGDKQRALGKKIEVKLEKTYESYTIIGVYQYDASEYGMPTGTSDQEITTNLYLPITTVMEKNGVKDQFMNATAIAKTGIDAKKVTDEMTSFLNQTFYRDNKNFSIQAYSMESMLLDMNKTLSSTKLAIAGIGAISLLVGGIGVMNIMIVSITERTREIGTRKALGATNRSIRTQFIVEAVVICLIGGLIGVILGIGIGIIISKLIGYPGAASAGSIVGSVMFSVAIGVFFGYYPANKAAKLNPIEALRYE